MPEVVAIVLAAGSSRRFGANKLLVAFEGVPLVRRTVQTVLDAGVTRVLVVLGHELDAVRAALDGLAVEPIVNHGYGSGMGGSLATGVAAAQGAGAYLIVLSDQPGLRSTTVSAIVSRFLREASNRTIVVPVAGQTLGHPVLFGNAYGPELQTLSGEKGGRAILDREQANLRFLEVDEAELEDVDTPVSPISGPKR